LLIFFKYIGQNSVLVVVLF